MSRMSVDPARVLQRLLAAGGEAALHAEVAMHAVALEDAHARIAELEQAAASSSAGDDQPSDDAADVTAESPTAD